MNDCVETFPYDPGIIVGLYRGAVVGDATPVFFGEDVVAPIWPDDFFFCGWLNDGELQAGPDNVRLLFDLEGGVLLDLTLYRAEFVGPVDEEGWRGVQFGAGLLPEGLRSDVLPALAAWLDGKLTSDASGEVARFAREFLDGQCSVAVDGCDPLPAGCALDGSISAEELQCNALVDELLEPDVDVSGDGLLDLISVGIEIRRTVPVTVVSP